MVTIEGKEAKQNNVETGERQTHWSWIRPAGKTHCLRRKVASASYPWVLQLLCYLFQQDGSIGLVFCSSSAIRCSCSYNLASLHSQTLTAICSNWRTAPPQAWLLIQGDTHQPNSIYRPGTERRAQCGWRWVLTPGTDREAGSDSVPCLKGRIMEILPNLCFFWMGESTNVDSPA